MNRSYSEITPYIAELAELSNQNNRIAPSMYSEHHVNRGLRDMNGKGVVTGLTEISEIKAKDVLPDGSEVPCNGQLFYRGVNIRQLVDGFLHDDRFGFEETVYLLLFSQLPNKEQLERFTQTIGENRSLAAVICAGHDFEGARQGHDEYSFKVRSRYVCL